MNGLTFESALPRPDGPSSEGRIVHFVMPNGVHRPAIVVHVWDRPVGTVNLTVFTDPNIDGENLRHSVQVEHSARAEAGTWHWMERA